MCYLPYISLKTLGKKEKKRKTNATISGMYIFQGNIQSLNLSAYFFSSHNFLFQMLCNFYLLKQRVEGIMQVVYTSVSYPKNFPEHYPPCIYNLIMKQYHSLFSHRSLNQFSFLSRQFRSLVLLFSNSILTHDHYVWHSCPVSLLVHVFAYTSLVFLVCFPAPSLFILLNLLSASGSNTFI